MDSIRNRVAIRLANLALRLADRRMQALIGGAIHYGLNAAARDEHEGRSAPPDWHDTPLNETDKSVRRCASGALLRWSDDDQFWTDNEYVYRSLSEANRAAGPLEFADA